MKSILTIFLLLLIACSSTSNIDRPFVEPIVYSKPDFNNVVESYISTGLGAQVEDPNVIIVYPKSSRFTGPRFTRPLPDQPAVKKVLTSFTCPVRGKVAIAVILDKDGTIKAPQLRRGIHTLCDTKAIQAIQKATVYPAKLDGKPIAMVLTFPITFK